MRRLSILAVVALAAGCTQQQYTTQGPVSTEPIVIDQAMQQRQWEPVTAAYENGQTFNPTTGFGYRPNGYNSPYAYAVSDTGTFLVNVITMPYTIYQQWDGVLSGGVQLPPSYTANPPLPPTTRPAE